MGGVKNKYNIEVADYKIGMNLFNEEKNEIFEVIGKDEEFVYLRSYLTRKYTSLSWEKLEDNIDNLTLYEGK